MSKRILALLLAVTMVVSMAAFPVSATETTEEPAVEEVIVPEQEAEVDATETSESEDTTTESEPVESVPTEGHTHCVCAGIPVNEKAGHTCENITWEAWSESEVALAGEATTEEVEWNVPAGTYYWYLDKDVTLNGERAINLNSANTHVYICLNGYTLTTAGSWSSGDGGRIFVQGANSSLTITDCSYDAADGTFDGKVTANTSLTGKGGGICNVLVKTGVLNIYGGNFTDENTTSTAGQGGLFNITGTMNIFNGNIYGGKSSSEGGNIYAAGTVNMYGGVISGGTANSSGANVYIKAGGTYNMYGGTVKDCVYVNNVYGGNFQVNGTLNVEGGQISGGHTAKAGGNILVQGEGKLYVKGGQIFGGKADDSSAGGNIKMHSSTALTVNNPTVEISGGYIWGGQSDNDANGASGTGSNIYVQCGTLTMTGGNIGIDANGNAQTTGGRGINGGNIYIAGGTVTLSGGTIAYGTATNHGGNIYTNAGTLNISGTATIRNGIATKQGGNLIVNTSPTVNITGGTFSDGQADLGGNVYIQKSLTISGASFSGGQATTNGGSLYLAGTSTTVSNVTVDGGVAGNNGGAIFFTENTNGTKILTNCTISNGQAIMGGNVYIPAQKTITITGGSISNGTALGTDADDNNDGMGGNLYVCSAATIEDTSFSGGEAQDRGGSIASNGGKLTVSDITVDGGEAAKSGGAIFITGSGAAGSTFTNCTVKNGSAGEGGNGGNLCVNPGSSATVTGGTYEAGSALNGGNICAFAACTIDGATIKDGQASGGAELASFNGGYYNLIGDTHIINSSGWMAVFNSATGNVTHTISGGTYEGVFAIDDANVVIEDSPVIDGLRMTKNAYKTPVDMTGYVNPAEHTIDLTLSGTALPTVFAYVDEDLSTIFNYADGSVVYTAGAGTGEDVDAGIDSGEGESGTGDVDSVGTLHVIKAVAEPETFQVTVPAGKTLYYEFATTNPALKITVSDNVTSETVDGVTMITNEGAEDVTATVTVEDLTGTAEYPINVVFEWNAAETEATATVTVPAGTTYYYESWNVTAENTLTANGVEVEFTPGSMQLRQPSAWSITNSSEEAVEYTLVVTYIEGTMNNPVDLTVGTADVPGENTAAVAEGGQPVYYEWKAPAAGELTITMTGSNWTYVIDNMSSYVYGDNHASNDKTVVSSETVLVKANQKIQVRIGTADYSEGDVTFTASFAGDSTSNPIMVDFVWNEEETEATATVKVPGKSTLYFGSWNITAENALTANDVAVEFVPGSMQLRQPSTWSISNTESAVAEYTLVVTFVTGSSKNPAELNVGTTAEPGANTAAVVGGGQPYFYEWTATADGKLTIAMTGSNWTYVINNGAAYGDNHASSDNEVVASETVDVKTGDVIQIVIGTDDYAAASVAFTAAFEEAVATITWYGRNVLLQDLLKVGMYFMASSEQEIEEVGALLWTGDEYATETDFTVTSTKAKKYENLQDVVPGYGIYYVESDGILAQNLDTVLYMIPYVKTEAGYVYGEVMGGEEKGSILSYAADVYLRDAASADTKHLVVDLLNYATAARTYFGYTEGLEAPETPFNSILSDEDKVVEWTESLNKEYPADITEGATYDVTVYGKNVVIQQALSITYYYLGNTTAGVMYWTEEDFNAADVYDKTTMSGEAELVRYDGLDTGALNGIFAYNIYDNYYFRAYDNNGDMSKIVGTSIAAYLTYLIEQNESSTEAQNIALVELAKAMQVYGENARTNPDVNKG